MLTIHQQLGLPLLFLVGVRVAPLFSFLCCVFCLLVFVLCLVSNVVCVSGLSILGCPSAFL